MVTGALTLNTARWELWRLGAGLGEGAGGQVGAWAGWGVDKVEEYGDRGSGTEVDQLVVKRQPTAPDGAHASKMSRGSSKRTDTPVQGRLPCASPSTPTCLHGVALWPCAPEPCPRT